MAVNKVILVGNIGSAPELRRTGGEKPVCAFRVATDHSFCDSSGRRKSHTEWHRVVCFGATAENCGKHLTKGKQVYVEGHIHTESWDDSQGAPRQRTRIIAHHVQFLSTPRGKSQDDPSIPEKDADISSDENSWP